MTVVGVVKDGKYRTLGEGDLPYLYLPLEQSYQPEMTLHIRGSDDYPNLAADVRREVRSLDPSLPVVGVMPLVDAISVSLLPLRLATAAAATFGMIGLLLAAVGIYGVMSYTVILRTREIGIRRALGAQARDILALILRRGLTLTSLGVIIGLAVALPLARLMEFLLYGVGVVDPVTFIGITALFAAVASCACYVPARRAAEVEPMAALRVE